MTSADKRDTSTLKFHDSVIARIAQALQEAMLTGTDVTDVLRSVQLKVSGEWVTLADGYADSVARHHAALLADIDRLSVRGG